MANWTVLRPGQINQAGASDALFLKVYAGEVLTTFETATVALPLTMVKTISSGKSAQFPATGIVAASYHVPGTEITGQGTNQNERIINIDDLLVAPVSIANIDEAKSHFDTRSEYTTQAGRALAKRMDKNILQTLVLTARISTPNVTGGFVGTQIINAAMNSDKTILKKAIKSSAQKFDENDVPDTDRHCVLPPLLHYLLLEDNEVTSRDYEVAAGSIRTGKLYELYGIGLHKSNNLPSTVITANTGENNTYNGTFTGTKAVVFHRSAVGTVKLLDLATEMEYSVSRQAHLVVAKYAVGHGSLRPECAIELATA